MGIEGNPAASLIVSLFNDVGGSPGSSILTLSGPSNPNVASLYTYSGIAALTSGSTYWLVASTGIYSDPSNEYIWYDGTLGDPGYVDTKFQRPPGGVSWARSGIVSPAAFRVNSVNQVPEPSILMLMGFGLAGIGYRRR